jgi:2-methylcitrate dehydratase PrpD
LRLAGELEGAADARIIGVAGRTSSSNAAFANGELMNALDWDPIPHTLPCMVPATLAIAEREAADGKTLILANALGNEIATRLSAVLPADLETRPHGYGFCVFGGVAGAGRLLGLSRAEMAHAFGIAGFAAPVPAMTRFESGNSPIPMTKYISTGWTAQAALTSALLARHGYTGDALILDGEQGFWRFFGGDAGSWDPERLTAGLGTSWRASKPWYKPYPCEIIIGIALNRLYDIMQREQLAPAEIESIEFLSLPLLSNHCHTTSEIVTHIDAQFSIPYVLAVAASGIAPGPAWQDEAAMRDPGVARLMARVSIGVHPDAERWARERTAEVSMGGIPCALTVHARSQRFDADRVEEPPLSDDALIAKFDRNATATLSSANANKARDLILDLENVEDVSALMDCLAP